MIFVAAMLLALQSQPLPAASASPPAATASPDGDALPPDCVVVERHDGNACAFDDRKGPAEAACIRAAQALERCGQQTTGFIHYAALMRAGSLWGMSAAWLGHRTARGHAYMEKARKIYLGLANDANAPETIRNAVRKTLVGLYGTDHPTSSTPFIIDRHRP